MNSINKKSPGATGIPQRFNPPAGHARRIKPVVAQLKTGVSAQSVKVPVAPPVYRPQPVPRVLQTKNATPQSRPTIQAPRPPVAQATSKTLQAKMATGTLNRISRVHQQRMASTASTTVQLAEDERQALIKKIEKNTNQVYEASVFVGNAKRKIKEKGWTETTPNTFTKNGATLAVKIEDDFGDYKIYGTYNDGTTVYAESYLTLSDKDGATVDQHYIVSNPEGQGIGYVLSLVAGRYLTGRGYRKVSISMQNTKSAPLARGLNEGAQSTGCCGGCFLTTACVEARGLPDDCEELSNLRTFRDTYMSSSKHLRALVDLYYEIAPRIVRAIQVSEDRSQELDEIYHTITRCVDLVKSEQYERAVDLYKQCVIRLANKYLPEESLELALMS